MTGPLGGTSRVFLDTNVLVYLYDRSELEKQHRAREVLAELARLEAGVVSTQVLAEFFSTLTRKMHNSLATEEILDQLQRHLRVWRVLDITGLLVFEAANAVRDHRLNFWDALIWTAARVNGIRVILSEDFSDGSVLGGVRFVNPFRPDFRLADWV